MPVAPLIGAQLFPPASQRSQAYEYRIPEPAQEPVQLPVAPVSVALTTGVPAIVGIEVLTGAVRGGAAELPLAKRLRSAASIPVTTHARRRPSTFDLSARNSRLYFPQARV